MKNLLFILIISSQIISCASKNNSNDAVYITGHNYRQLQARDLDEMTNMALEKVRLSRKVAIDSQDTGNEKEGEKQVISILKEAMVELLSRPNTSNDNMVAKVSPMIKRELNNYDAYHKVMERIVYGAINTVNNKDFETKHRVSASFVIENSLSELKPSLVDKIDMVKDIYVTVVNSNIEYDRKVRSTRLLNTMHKSLSPSTIAKRILLKVYGKKAKKKDFYK